jgi:hemerythrin superfamily protein
MLKSEQAASSSRDASRFNAKAGHSAKPVNAITLLKADHRQVAEWFEEFEKSRSADKKAALAQKICAALRAHTTIEEEIFYPAFLEATGDTDIHHEAEVEHAGAKALISQIEKSDPSDDHFDAKVKVLSELIRHHVKEEEQPDGMFAEARDSQMDLEELGARLQARKEELTGENGAESQGRT